MFQGQKMLRSRLGALSAGISLPLNKDMCFVSAQNAGWYCLNLSKNLLFYCLILKVTFITRFRHKDHGKFQCAQALI